MWGLFPTSHPMRRQPPKTPAENAWKAKIDQEFRENQERKREQMISHMQSGEFKETDWLSIKLNNNFYAKDLKSLIINAIDYNAPMGVNCVMIFIHLIYREATSFGLSELPEIFYLLVKYNAPLPVKDTHETRAFYGNLAHYKEIIFLYIQSKLDTDNDAINMLERVFTNGKENTQHPMGKLFWTQRGFLSCALTRGTLKNIVLELNNNHASKAYK